MKASLRAIRIAPKKAQLIAKMIRGKSVPDAVYTLERTNKKAARILEQLLRSAMANASHNEKQDPQMLTIKTLTVNKAQAYHRGVPMARGRVRPMRKFMSHIHLTLGVATEEGAKEAKGAKGTKGEKEGKDASPAKKTMVKKTLNQPSAKADPGSEQAKTSTKGKSAKTETAASSSKSSVSPQSPKK